MALEFATAGTDVAAARPTDRVDALNYILRGRAAFTKGATPENFAQAIDLLEHALAMDPRAYRRYPKRVKFGQCGYSRGTSDKAADPGSPELPTR